MERANRIRDHRQPPGPRPPHFTYRPAARGPFGLVLVALASGFLPPAFSETEQPAVNPTIRGKIVGMRPKVEDVIIDVGELNGVKKGMLFRAYRGTQLLAHLKVYFVLPDMSAAQIVRKAGDLRFGDPVTTRLLEADTSKAEPLRPSATDVPPKDLSLPEVRGAILAMRERTGLVALSLGTEHGVIPGTRLTVARGNEWVGTVVAQHVEAKLTIAKVEHQRLEFQKGDIVYVQDAKPMKP